MPRPNRPRSVLAEVNLAQRVAHERAARRWSPEGLARRMADAGCSINVSAIYRIEQADPPRRITVDELVGFSRVFGIPVQELLLPPEVARSRELARLVIRWDTARVATQQAQEESEAAWTELKEYAAEHEDSDTEVQKAIGLWAEFYFTNEQSDAAAALKMWQLTGDESFADAYKAANRDLYPDGDGRG